jgi:hypothetical protein
VLQVAQDDDWLNASEIAHRVGRTRQSIGLLVRGQRGPGGFPVPVARHGSPNPLWSWAEVETWFGHYEPAAVQEQGPKLSPDFLAELNDRLDLRERRRHSPQRPVAPKTGSSRSARRLSSAAQWDSTVVTSRRHADPAPSKLCRQF